MINDIQPKAISYWKYIDDITTSEIVKRHTCSTIQDSINDIQQWSKDNRLQLNGTKCKELRIYFGKDVLDFANIRIDGIDLEIVTHVKILGLTISGDLKWNQHVQNVVKKANKRIYFIVQLKRAKLPPSEILLFYCSCVRPILEYGSQVFHYGLPMYLSDVIERVQQRVLSIIYPGCAHTDSLRYSNLQILYARREEACSKLFKSIESNPNHKHIKLIPPRMVQHHCLRKQREFMIPRVNTNRCSNTFIMSSVTESNRLYDSLVP